MSDLSELETGMNPISLPEAQATLPELVHRLGPGDEVVLTEDDRPVAKLIATGPWPGRTPKLGTQAGSVLFIAPDFDAPLESFGV